MYFNNSIGLPTESVNKLLFESVLSLVLNRDVKFSYISIIINYLEPENVKFENLLLKNKYTIKNISDCNHLHKDVILYVQHSPYNGRYLSRLPLCENAIPYLKMSLCLPCFSLYYPAHHDNYKNEYNNIVIFDYKTGQKNKKNLLGLQYKYLQPDRIFLYKIKSINYRDFHYGHQNGIIIKI